LRAAVFFIHQPDDADAPASIAHFTRLIGERRATAVLEPTQLSLIDR